MRIAEVFFCGSHESFFVGKNMTIEEARKILTKDGNNYTDSQLQLMIDCFNKIIEAGFQQFERINMEKGFDNGFKTN